MQKTNLKQAISDLEIEMHNLTMAKNISDDLNKKKSVLLFTVSMDKTNELNIVAGIPDNLCIEIMEQLLKGMKQGMKIKTF